MTVHCCAHPLKANCPHLEHSDNVFFTFLLVYNDHPAKDHEALYQLHLNVQSIAALDHIVDETFTGVTATSSGRESCV